MPKVVGRPLVKDSILDLLASGPKRYSDIVRMLERPDKTIYQSLERLQKEGLVRKKTDGLYELSKERSNQELARIEEARLPAATDIVKGALQSRKDIGIGVLRLAYVLLLFVAKAASGQKVLKLKKVRIEAADQLQTVKKILDERAPNWIEDYLKSGGKEMEDSINKMPEGLPYALFSATMAYSLETALRLLEKDLPKDKTNELLIKARRIAADTYEELMREVLEKDLTT
jgi:hypothetical protein